MRPVTSSENHTFEALTSGRYGNLAVASTEFDGIETAVIVAIDQDGSDFVLTPLAVIVNDRIASKLAPPDNDF